MLRVGQLAAIGAVFGLSLAAGEVRSNAYLELGLYRNALLVLRDHVAWWAVFGAASGIGYLMSRFTGRAVRRLWSTSPLLGAATGGALHRVGHGLNPYLVALAASAPIIGLVSILRTPFGVGRIWLVFLGAIGWSVVFFFWRRLRQDPGQAATYRASVLSGILVATPLLVPAAATLLERRHLKTILGYEFMVLVMIVVLGVLASWLSAAARRSLGWVLRPLAIVPVVVIPPALWLASALFVNQAFLPSTPDNVIVIGIDTIRQDHTTLGSPEEYFRDLTPGLRQFAARGTIFETTVSQAPWTMPAFSSIMTGKYPREHGAGSLNGYLRESEVTLAEILREAGYQTGAVISNFNVGSETGFAQGFDHVVEDFVRPEMAITSELVTDSAIEFFEEHRDGPFFLFALYFDPHATYMDHPDLSFADGYSGWVANTSLSFSDIVARKHLLEPSDLQYLIDLYDEEIAYTDRQVSRLLAAIEHSGIASNTAIVVVGDHGEEFLERGWLQHTHTVHRELVRVPLVLYLPSLQDAPSKVTRVVETRAVFGTVLDYLGLGSRSVDSAHTLLPLMMPGTPAATTPDTMREAYTEVWLPENHLRSTALRTAAWKLIHNHELDLIQLFDLRSDPGEVDDVSGRHPEKFLDLKSRLDAWIARMPVAGGATRNLDSGDLERLRALGYVR